MVDVAGLRDVDELKEKLARLYEVRAEFEGRPYMLQMIDRRIRDAKLAFVGLVPDDTKNTDS